MSKVFKGELNSTCKSKKTVTEKSVRSRMEQKTESKTEIKKRQKWNELITQSAPKALGVG